MAKQISELKLGILGGGQLGRMLIQQAINYNIKTLVLDPDYDAPCKDISTYFECGSITDFDTVCNFGRRADIVTIEIEKVNADALEQLEKEGKQVFPQSRIIRLIQDKGSQKQFFRENGIPTANYKLTNNKEDLHNTGFSYPFMLKQRRDGYDGRGVMKISNAEEIDGAFEEPSLVEEMISFEKEVSVIVSRNASGETAAFPLVEMDFNPAANLVEFLISPSEYSENIQQEAQEIAVRIAGLLGIIGILAVEMFVTREGTLLVNELAPRPHNSGHQTIEGNFTSQYDQHIRAICNLSPGNTATRDHAVMINLLGEPGHSGKAKYQGLEEILKMPGVSVHLYGKKITKPFRKMGHVTVVYPDRDKAIEMAKFIKENLKVVS